MLPELVQTYLIPTLVLSGLYLLFQAIAVLHIHLFELEEVVAESVPETPQPQAVLEESMPVLAAQPIPVRSMRRF